MKNPWRTVLESRSNVLIYFVFCSRFSFDQGECKKQQYQDEVDRIEIEGKFGVAKRRYSLCRIMNKLSSTSESVIALAFLVMNLQKLVGFFVCFSKTVFFT